MTLPPGVVCDACNNYFASKVEKPFLELPAIEQLRLTQAVPSKKKRLPQVQGTMNGVDAVATGGLGNDPFRFEFDRWVDAATVLDARAFIGPPAPKPPTEVISRFLVKVALEYLAHGYVHDPDRLAWMVDLTELDVLRGHARYGNPRRWPFTARQTYPAGQLFSEDGELRQRVWEAIVFGTDDGMPFFSVAFFGSEFVIPLAEPDLRSFRRWVIRHPGESPLYQGEHRLDPNNEPIGLPPKLEALIVVRGGATG